MEFMVGLLLQTSATLTQAQHSIGLVAAVLLAVLAAYAGWNVTDRLIAGRQRPDGD